MANTIVLSSDVPVVAPGKTLTITAKVVDSVTGAPAPGATVNWTITQSNAMATLGTASSTTSDTGYTSNTVDCLSKAALTITGALDDGSKLTATLKVGFYSDNLAVPVVPQAEDGVLNEKEVISLVQAMVTRHTDDPEVGDLYTFHWGKSELYRIDNGTSTTFPWIIDVQNSFTVNDVLADGIYTVYYMVLDSAGNTSYSKPLSITVTGGTYTNPIYDAPEFPSAINNIINEEVINNDQGVKVNILYPQTSDDAEIFADNVITLYMKIFDKDYLNEIVPSTVIATYTVKADDLKNNTIEFTIPKEVLTDNKDTFDNVRGQFWYTVTGSGSVAVSGTSFTKSLIIDTVAPHLV